MSKQQIQSSTLSEVNKRLKVEVSDTNEPFHNYTILLDDTIPLCQIDFQTGPSQQVGVNGITDESLLSILIHRLQSFQKGPFACRENAIALTHIDTALLWLEKRSADRQQRGVEGYDKP